MKNQMISFLKEDKGQGMVEYGLIIALVAIAVIAAVTLLGEQLDVLFDRIGGILTKQNSVTIE